ncbi:MAG TPA: hypothetical protein VFO01_07730 [Trebonia sp.]|nr:hypothetical protein [Trebonia sp.]
MNRGELPGYEFEVPRGPHPASGPRHVIGHDSLRYLQDAPAPEPGAKSPVRAAGSGVFDIMRKRNWLMGLAAPILAAIVIGVAVVVVTGGGSTSTAVPSALAAGFPPARLAPPSFTGNTPASRVILAAIGASDAIEVAAGGMNGGPALWTSSNGGTDWARVALRGAAALTRAGTGQFAGVAHGPVGWLAVGSTLAGKGGPLVASSADARTWTVTGATAGPDRGNPVAVAAGPAGYVIVGHQSLGGSGKVAAAAWYAPGLAGWRPAVITPAGNDIQMMNAVTATARGFVAVGATGSAPAAWLSAAGQAWRQVRLPAPAGAARAALDYVTANGSAVLAAGTEFSAAGASRPFTEASADAGTTWTEVQLPVPDVGPGTGTTVTGLTAAGGGFTAVGTYVTQAGPEVVIWTLPPGTPVTDGAAWATVTPQGEGLSGPKSENTLTAITVDGVTVTGVGFTADLTAPGTPGPQQPTLWQSPVRY